ncbi:hypothetical protein L596_013657 [Steinernema carpocapsae]|uniref:Uncharacterized protein n=1 Tax=Steinernema carpocapsae TaxID=34508 RepID=A0A4U5P0U2_STECR|nr:hypothetical protein L596_013657 [Steinernema carpocapsae]
MKTEDAISDNLSSKSRLDPTPPSILCLEPQTASFPVGLKLIFARIDFKTPNLIYIYTISTSKMRTFQSFSTQKQLNTSPFCPNNPPFFLSVYHVLSPFPPQTSFQCKLRSLRCNHDSSFFSIYAYFTRRTASFCNTSP